MPAKKNKKKRNFPNPTARTKHINVIPSPQIKCVEHYVKSWDGTLQLNKVTISIKNSHFFITTQNKTTQANVPKFIGKQFKGYKQSIVRDVRHSKHANQQLRQRRKHWNHVKHTWKEWYTNHSKINQKFKAVSQYFGKFIRQRNYQVPSHKQGKRSRVDYFQEEVHGRKRDRLKAECAKQSKKKKQSRRAEKRWKNEFYIPKSMYNCIRNTHKETGSQISKLKFIPDNSDERNNISKTEKKNRYKFRFNCTQQ